ncbi:MAG: hypothetical protein Q4C01_07380 [Clostridia bacterium]|nr:hypothetical protein [Clostridia bacterium]
MKDVKTRSTDNTPRTLTNAARAPKELTRKMVMETRDTAELQSSQEENPTQYAET